jgi:hypothetical protein
MTIGGVRQTPQNALRLTLRVYTDGRDQPDVEVPVGPFFGIHHGHEARTINSPFIQVTDRAGFNCYFPMPYRDGLRLTLQNEGDQPFGIWFQLDYQRYAPGTLGEEKRFCALYRRVNPAERYGQPYHIGRGQSKGFIAGVTLGMRVFDTVDSWYHCGGDLVLLDGGSSGAHLLSGIGGEDFFGTAWGQDVFSNGPIGSPYYDVNDKPSADEPRITFAAYRFFDPDPIVFTESFWYDFGSLANDMSSVIYWYQTDPVVPAMRIPSKQDKFETWDVCGPFSRDNRDEFERSAFPEKTFDVSQIQPADFGQYALAAKRTGHQAKSRWIEKVESKFSFVDLTPYFRPRLKTNAGLPTKVCAYARRVFTVQSDVKGRLRIGHDDWFRLWHNSRLIYDGPQHKGFETTEVDVTLRRGENIFLAKVANQDNANYRAWVFLFDFLDDAVKDTE